MFLPGRAQTAISVPDLGPIDSTSFRRPGFPPQVSEDTQPTMTHPLSSDDARAERVFAEFLSRREAGEEIELEALLGEHPGLSARLRQMHEEWRRWADMLEGALPGSISSVGQDSPPPDFGGSASTFVSHLEVAASSRGRYRFRALVTEGGQGVILKVWDRALNRPLAMKVALGKGEEVPTGETPEVDERTLARFLEEAQVTSQLDHPGVVPVHELGVDTTGRAYFTMRLVRGRTFHEVIEDVHRPDRGGGGTEWTLVRALGALQRVCEAMSYAHSRGIVHRDLKPGNVMVGRFGEVYVMDWGLARVRGRQERRDIRLTVQTPTTESVHTVRREARDSDPDSPLFTMDGTVVGTPAYMPPEQARGEAEDVGPLSDVYAIGAMLYHLLAGHMPYVAPGTRASNYAVWRWVMEGPPSPLSRAAPEAPSELVSICEKAMSREREARYGGVEELREDLQAYLEGRVVRAHRTGVWMEVRKWVARNRALATTMGCLAVVITLGVAMATYLEDRRAEQEREMTGEIEELAGENRRSQYLGLMRRAQLGIEDARYGEALAALDSCPPEERGLAWGLLHCQAGAIERVRLREGSTRYEVSASAYTPDGDRIILGWGDGAVTCLNPQSDQQPVTLMPPCGHDQGGGEVTFIETVANGRQCVSVHYRGRITLHTTSGEEPGVRLSEENDRGTPDGLALSPDGTLLALSNRDDSLRIWDLESRQLVFDDTPYEESFSVLCISPDGSLLAGASSEGSIKILDVEDGTWLREIGPPAGRVFALTFDAKGTTLLSFGRAAPEDASSPPELTEWSLATSRKPRTTFSLDPGSWCNEDDFTENAHFDFHEGLPWLVFTSHMGLSSWCDKRGLKTIHGLANHDPFLLRSTERGLFVCVGWGIVRIGDLAEHRLVEMAVPGIYGMSDFESQEPADLSPDGEHVLFVDSEDPTAGTVVKWQAMATIESLKAQHADDAESLPITSDELLFGYEDGRVAVHNRWTGEKLGLLRTSAHFRTDTPLFLSGGSALATGWGDSRETTRAWDIQTGEPCEVPDALDRWSEGVRWTPESSLADCTLLLDCSVAGTSGPRTVAVKDGRHNVRLLECDGGEEIARFERPEFESEGQVLRANQTMQAFTSQGDYVRVALNRNKMIWLETWRRSDGQLLSRECNHELFPYGVIGERVLSVNADQKARRVCCVLGGLYLFDSRAFLEVDLDHQAVGWVSYLPAGLCERGTAFLRGSEHVLLHGPKGFLVIEGGAKGDYASLAIDLPTPTDPLCVGNASGTAWYRDFEVEPREAGSLPPPEPVMVGEDAIAFYGDRCISEDRRDYVEKGIHVWHLPDRKELGFIHVSSPITALEYSSSNGLLVAGDVLGGVTVWDLESGAQVGRAQTSGGTIGSLHVSPDGGVLVSRPGRCDMRSARMSLILGAISAWDLPNLHPLWGDRDGQSTIAAVDFQEASGTIACVDDFGAVTLWDPASGERIAQHKGADQPVGRICFDTESGSVVCGYRGGVLSWNPMSGGDSNFQEWPFRHSFSAAYAPQLFRSYDESGVYAADCFLLSNPPQAVALFGPGGDGSGLCSLPLPLLSHRSSGANYAVRSEGPGEGWIYRPISQPQFHASLAATTSGDRIICLSEYRGPSVLRASDGAPLIHMLDSPQDFVARVVATDETDRLVACADLDGIAIWDLETGIRLGAFPRRDENDLGNVLSLEFLDGGTALEVVGTERREAWRLPGRYQWLLTPQKRE